MRRGIVSCLLIALFAAAIASAGETEDAEKILAAYAAGNVETADTALNAFLTAYPNSPRKCDLLLAGGRAPQPLFEAIRRLRRTVDTCSGQPAVAPALAEVARLSHLSGQDLAARGACRDFLTQFPDHELAPQVLLLQGALEMSYQGGRLAGTSFAQFLEKYPDDPQRVLALVGLADAKVKHSDWSGVHQAYLQALQAGPDALDMPKVLFYLGHTAEMMGEQGRARHFYQELLRLYPNTAYSARARDRLDTVLTVGSRRMQPPEVAEMRYTVFAGRYATLAEAEKAAQRFAEAGHKTRCYLRSGSCELLVGVFETETDARLFAEELSRRYGISAQAVPMP